MTSVQKPWQSPGRRSSYLAGQGREQGAGLGPESASWGRRRGRPGSWAKSQLWAGSQRPRTNDRIIERIKITTASPALCTHPACAVICDLTSSSRVLPALPLRPPPLILIFRKVSEACPRPSATQPQADATSLGLSFPTSEREGG